MTTPLAKQHDPTAEDRHALRSELAGMARSLQAILGNLKNLPEAERRWIVTHNVEARLDACRWTLEEVVHDTRFSKTTLDRRLG